MKLTLRKNTNLLVGLVIVITVFGTNSSLGAGELGHYTPGVAGDHAVIVADNSAEPQHLVFTANQDTIYLSGVLDLAKGAKRS